MNLVFSSKNSRGTWDCQRPCEQILRSYDFNSILINILFSIIYNTVMSPSLALLVWLKKSRHS